MLNVRKAEARGHTDFGWLDSRHTFSFGQYYDPQHMGFGPLRVINDDRVAGGGGFPSHPHRDVEIVTVVLSGALAHKDSLGTGSTISAGDVQRMSAGTGIMHSEFNASKSDPVHFLQIWIMPEKHGLAPGYEQKTIAADGRSGLRLIGSRDGRDGSVTIHQDVSLYTAKLVKGESLTHELATRRGAWLHMARGKATVNGEQLKEGDSAALKDVNRLVLVATDPDAEVLLFDVAV